MLAACSDGAAGTTLNPSTAGPGSTTTTTAATSTSTTTTTTTTTTSTSTTTTTPSTTTTTPPATTTTPPTTTTTPSITTTTSTTTTTTPTLPDDPLAAFGLQPVMVGDQEWIVAFADEPAERRQGLMGVTDLGVVDGMLFVWEEDVFTAFWMKDTLIPLDIAFFTASGELIEVISMVPCEADPCELYRPSLPFRFALEADPGRFIDAGRLTLLP